MTFEALRDWTVIVGCLGAIILWLRLIWDFINDR
jgi:hypothetical protein